MVDVCLDPVQDTRVYTHALRVIRDYNRFYVGMDDYQLFLSIRYLLDILPYFSISVFYHSSNNHNKILFLINNVNNINLKYR